MRSTKTLWRVSLGLSIVGLLLSIYLTVVRFADVSLLCTGVGGCDAVQQSAYSAIAGIPVAVIGLLGYAAILAALILEVRGGSLGEAMPYAVFGFTMVGFLFSAYLTYLELAVIDAICPYCVASALLMTALFGLAVYRMIGLLREDNYLD